MKFVFLSLFLSFYGCGDSPFVEKDVDEKEREIQTATNEVLSFSGVDIRVNRFWKEGPRVGPASELLIVLTDSNNKPIKLNERLDAKIMMPRMGHGSAPIKVTDMGEGVYKLERIYFIMPGYWDFHLEIYKDDSLWKEVIWPIEL